MTAYPTRDEAIENEIIAPFAGETSSHDQTMSTVLAVLGNLADDFSRKRGTDGLDQLCQVLEAIEEAYPGDDSADARMNAFGGATSMGFGDETLESLAGALFRARRAEAAAMETLTGAIKWAATGGATESQIVAATGLARNTVRRAMGM